MDSCDLIESVGDIDENIENAHHLLSCVHKHVPHAKSLMTISSYTIYYIE